MATVTHNRRPLRESQCSLGQNLWAAVQADRLDVSLAYYLTHWGVPGDLPDGWDRLGVELALSGPDAALKGRG